MNIPFPFVIIILVIILFIAFLMMVQNKRLKRPTHEECEECANKKGETEIEKYGSAEKFRSCLVVGAPSAHMSETSNLMIAARRKKKHIEQGGTKRQRYLLLREMRSLTNLSYNSAHFAMQFPFRNKLYTAVMIKYFNGWMKEARELQDWIDNEIARLDKNFPKLKNEMDQEVKNVMTDCDGIEHKIKSGKIKHPENLFIKDDNYRKIVIPFAEIGKNFYLYLDNPKKS